jgi:hypothetical protein
MYKVSAPYTSLVNISTAKLALTVTLNYQSPAVVDCQHKTLPTGSMFNFNSKKLTHH